MITTEHPARNEATRMHDGTLAQLRAIVGERLSVSISDRNQHGRDPAHPDGAAPDAVAYPETTEEVAALVHVCAEYGLAVIPYGTGTSLEGHVSAPEGGLTIDLSRMNRVIEINGEDMDVRVEAGVTRKQLNQDLRDTGLFFPIDPGADASIGGMASTRASGTNAVRYGTMRHAVLGLSVVTAAGDIIRTGGRARKSSAGYDLTGLYVGAEGTLGVITEVQLRVHPRPETVAVAVASFSTLTDAVGCVILILQMGVHVARIELLDQVQMRACRQYSKLSLEEAPTLFMEFHGGPAAVHEQLAQVCEAVVDTGGAIKSADDPSDRASLWQARHDAYWAAMALRPGARMMTTDVCVPISRLAECIGETRADFDARSLTAPILGHVGDGNFHCFILYAESDPAELASAAEANHALVERAIRMGGTCTGEHGIGAGKREFLLTEHETSVEVMKAIKHALDPKRMFNPGKILI